MDTGSVEEIQAWLDEFLWPEPDGKQRAKRQRILRSATGLFVQYGYRRTPIDEVASAAGVAKGTVYLYYRNKAELVLHAIALEKSGYVERLLPLLAEPITPAARLQSLIALGLISTMEMPLLSRLIGGDQELALALSEVDASVLERVNGFRADFMISLLDEATGGTLSEQLLRERAQVLIDLISGVATSGALAGQGPDLESYVWTLAGALVNGIGAPPGPEAFRPIWSATSDDATAEAASDPSLQQTREAAL